VWVYSRIKNREAPLAWMVRVIHPDLTSCEMRIMFEKAVSVLGEYSIDRMIPDEI